MLITPIQLKIANASLCLVAALAVVMGSYLYGVGQGKSDVSAKWEKEKRQLADANLILTTQLHDGEFRHRQESLSISEQLRKTEAKYEATVSDLVVERSQRLLASDQRSAIYQHLAEAGPAECRDLASHTAELDRALEEGRGLVGEFQAVVGQREDQLRLLGAQLTADRKLLGGM